MTALPGLADRPEPRVEVSPDADTLAEAVAGALIGRLSDLEDSGHEPHIALTGGTIARRIHSRVAAHHADADGDLRRIDWTRVHIWWGDERFVAHDSSDRNAGQARADLLDHIGPAQIHEIPSSDEVASAEESASSYSAQVRSVGGGAFDIVMLGVGPDGHIASLFPGYPQLGVDDDIAVAVHDSPKPPPDRITLTYPALNRAHAVWFLVSGAEKADAVARALAPVDPDSEADALRITPARGVRGLDSTTWFLDSPAATLL